MSIRCLVLACIIAGGLAAGLSFLLTQTCQEMPVADPPIPLTLGGTLESAEYIGGGFWVCDVWELRFCDGAITRIPVYKCPAVIVMGREYHIDHLGSLVPKSATAKR